MANNIDNINKKANRWQALNSLPISGLPFIGKTKKRLEIFNAENAAAYAAHYRGSFGIDAASFGKDGKLNSTGVLKTYQDERIVDISGFSTKFKDKDGKPISLVNAPDGKSISEKLADNSPETIQIRSQISSALKLNANTKKAIETFEKEMAVLNESVRKDPPLFRPKEIASYIQELRTSTRKALEDQQKEEITNLENLLNHDAGFLNNLTAKMGIDSNNSVQVDKLKKDMIDGLKKSHQEELGESDDPKKFGKFEKALDAQVKDLHELERKENDRIAYFAAMYNNKQSAKMKKAIDDWYEANKGPNAPNGASLSINFDKNLAKFKGLKPSNLDLIETITGRKITYTKEKNKDGKEEGVFTMQLPRFDPTYYYSRSQQIEYDLVSMAQAIRADGNDKITLNIDYRDEKYALELARKAYEAALKAGFAPEDIAITVNNKHFFVPQGSVQAFKEKYKGEGQVVNTVADGLFGSKYKVRRTVAENEAERDKKEREGAMKKYGLSSTEVSAARQQEIKNTIKQMTQPNTTSSGNTSTLKTT
ncbi:hypothetical protein ACNVED_11230 [Legionella sp. D16C41]|uniref:hypothetical protein n=1 Tax=Legionella sp. D16C41 TaxID=3402688 RepID=UPI003AF4AD1D